MLNMTGIEEIVKYQKELLNHQRNQKLIQKETIKLLNALNKNITFMSDRLDEFALKTNIKLEINSSSNSSSSTSAGNNNSQNHPINVNTIHELNNVNSNDEFFNSSSFYDPQLNSQHHNLNQLTGISGGVGVGVPQITNNQMPINLNEDIKEYYILSDCNLEPLSVVQNSIGQNQIIQNHHQQHLQPNQQHLQQQQQQQLVLIRPDPPVSSLPNNNTKANNNSNKNSPKIKSSPNKLNNSRSNNRLNKLLDTTNTSGANITATSEESLDDDLSMDETSEDEKETIQIRKKPKASYPATTTSTVQSHSIKSKEYEESHNQQRLFNKYVRENVENRLGKEFLLLHEIQEIDHDVMESIKKDALEVYPPINIRPRRAWHLAKASLRCRRRSLRRQKEKQILLNPSSSTLNTMCILNNQSIESDTTTHAQTMITMTHL